LPQVTESCDIAQRTAAHTRNGKALTRTSVASWRTLLQRAKQTALGPDLANVRIDETPISPARLFELVRASKAS